MTADPIQQNDDIASLIHNNDLAGLETACSGLLRDDSDNIGALEILTAVYLDTNRPAKAEQTARHRIVLNNHSATAHRDLGNALLSQVRTKEAKRSFEEAIKKDPLLAGAHFGLGRAHTAQGDLQAAISEFDQALTIDPDHAAAQIALANALTKQGQTFLALTTLQQLTEKRPNLAIVNLWVGNLLQETGQLDIALEKFELAVRDEPTYIDQIARRGVLLHHSSAKVELSDTLFAFYDLGTAPLTFNFVHFLILAEMHRLEMGYARIHIVIVPGTTDGYGGTMSNDSYLLQQGRDWRLSNVIVSGCRLLPSCKGITLCASRQEAHEMQESISRAVFPAGYRCNIPHRGRRATHAFALRSVIQKTAENIPVAYIQASQYARNFVKSWCDARADSRPIVSVTLRDHEYMPDRNSDIESWAKFCRWASDLGFFPVIVPDTESLHRKTAPELNGIAICCEAAINIDVRTALYEQSYISLHTGAGPNALLYHNKNTRYVILKLIVESHSESTAEFFENTNGIKVGQQLPWSKPWQRLAYVDDSFENIRRQFCEVVEILESNNAISNQTAPSNPQASV